MAASAFASGHHAPSPSPLHSTADAAAAGGWDRGQMSRESGQGYISLTIAHNAQIAIRAIRDPASFPSVAIRFDPCSSVFQAQHMHG